MDERARQGAERLRRAAARTGGALSQAAGRAAEQAGAWGRAAEQAGRAASQVAGHAARAADAARSTLPGGIRSGQEFEGTLFQRRLATALATRPHARSLGTNVLGASPLRTGLSLGWRRKRTLEREGFDTTVAPGGVLDAAVDEGPGGRVERDLPGDVDEGAAVPPGGHRLGVGADGGRCIGRGDGSGRCGRAGGGQWGLLTVCSVRRSG